MKKLWLFLLPVLAWTTACKSSQKVVYAPEQIVPTEKSVLWKISGNGLEKPSYLLGTIHLIPKSEFTASQALQNALDETRRITFEIDMKEMTNIKTQLGILPKAMMAGGKTLKDLLPAEDYAFVHAKMQEKGLPGGMFERLKPMFLSMMFSSDEAPGTSKETTKMTSVEMEVYKLAKKRKMESAGLETTAYQISIFDSIPYEVQAKMLVEGLRQEESATADKPGEDELDMLLRLYKDQDINSMQSSISNEGGFGDYENLLLGNRNRNWIPIMGKMMKEKPTLFAVGAGHLGGKGGVVALLRTAGYRVEAVKQ